MPHDVRWSLPLPDWRAIDRYLDETLGDAQDTLAASRDGERYFFELALYHEDMHGEALLMTLQTLGLPLPPSYPRADAAPAGAAADSEGDVTIAGGPFALGTRPGADARRFVNARGSFGMLDRTTNQTTGGSHGINRVTP